MKRDVIIAAVLAGSAIALVTVSGDVNDRSARRAESRIAAAPSGDEPEPVTLEGLFHPLRTEKGSL